MSALKIRQALEKHLATLAPSISTAYENADFTPVNGVAYQRANLLPAAPDNSSMGDKYYRELGVFQVTLYYPVSTGPKDAYTRAESVKTLFKRGTTLTQGGVDVTIIFTPTINPAFYSDDRYCLPISIYYQADIFL